MGFSASGQKVIGLSGKDFAAKTKEKGALILDVRTPEEYKTGNISGSRNLDWFNQNSFSKFVGGLKDKNAPVLVYCQKGIRSQSAASYLTKQGFTQVYHLKGGYDSYGK